MTNKRGVQPLNKHSKDSITLLQFVMRQNLKLGPWTDIPTQTVWDT